MASPEGKKVGTLEEQQRRRSNSNNSSSNNNNSPGGGSVKTPVIRHRDADARVTIRGWLYKQGSDGLQLWKKRWFVLSQFCLFYYHGPEEEKVLGSLLLPSYTIRPCLAGDRDRVYRKFAFKAQHRNTRSFYLAAESRESMIQWMNALSLAAILQDPDSASATPTRRSEKQEQDVSFDDSASGSGTGEHQQQQRHPCTTTGGGGGQRQPLYANAPPKPRRLNTSRDSPSCSSSPDRSPDQSSTEAVAPPGAMFVSTNGNHWNNRRPVSAEVTALLQQQQRLHHPIPAERRTPDAYGRFKTEYEDVYNNGSGTPPAKAFVVTHRSEVARRVPPRPHSVDILHQQQQQRTNNDYWASEENYAQQVRKGQSSVLRNNFQQPRDPAEISRDVKESALWSYVQQTSTPVRQPPPPVLKKVLSNSQENLLENGRAEEEDHGLHGEDHEEDQMTNFKRSASARILRVQQETLNSSQSSDHRVDQREESMKRLLEWKQRMLQSPLTRKGGGGSGGTRSSERSTPTHGMERESSIPSPVLPIQNQQQQQQQSPSGGNFVTLRRTVARATQDLLNQEQIYQQNLAFRASLKSRPSVADRIRTLDEESDVKKEFTYEYVVPPPPPSVVLPLCADGGQQHLQQQTTAIEQQPPPPPKPCWPQPSLMREKSSAVADLRARSESPSANRVLATPPRKTRPTPPPKPSLHDMQMAYQLKLRSGLAALMMQQQEEDAVEEEEEDDRESLPESLAGFAASIVSEEGNGGAGVESAVSPLISECDWPHNTTGNGSPAPLPDLMSLASYQQHSENLYMNALVNAASVDHHEMAPPQPEDTYLPMAAKIQSPPPLPAANNCSPNGSNYYQPMQAQPQHPGPVHQLSFEENAYVEMTDNGRIKISPRRNAAASVFAGVLTPSYLPESPRYTEINANDNVGINPPEANNQSHYEFIYKASANSQQNEPVYMEVPQEHSPTPAEEAEESIHHHHQRQSSLVSEEDLGAIAPPRHPRFSISDTFRPASYFVKTATLETPCEQDESGSDGSELVSPPPIPPAAVQHSRSQSLDYNAAATRSQSRTSLASAASDLARRRPLTIVRSLEDLLVEAGGDDQSTSSTNQRSSTTSSSAIFRGGSTQSLAWHQPLYENVITSPPQGGGASHHIRQASRVSSNASTRRMSSSPAEQHQRQRLGSMHSISSTVSNSSMCRSDQSSSGAPYYYSDLHQQKPPSAVPPPVPLQEEQIVVADSSDTASLRSSKSAQAAKQAYQHSMDRLRAAQQQRNNPPRQQQQLMTPDLLANSTPPPPPPQEMRRVRSLEGLLQDGGGIETPRYTGDPCEQHQQEGEEFSSPWDEDQLWRDKLRRASIRHTRSMEMLDEIPNASPGGGAAVVDPGGGGSDDCSYERLLQYSATLERTKRGQTYLDGYMWDEKEQRFNQQQQEKEKKEMTTSPAPFLEDGLPSPGFEIDREKLRQWDLMSTSAVPEFPVRGCTKEGGRRPAAVDSTRPADSSLHLVNPPPPPPTTTTTNNSPEHKITFIAPPTTQRQQPVSSPVQRQQQNIRPPPQSSFARQQQQQQQQQPDLTVAHYPPPPVVASTCTGGTSPVQAAVVATATTTAQVMSSSAAAHTSRAINGIKVAYHQSGLRVTSSLVKSPFPPQHPPPAQYNNTTMRQQPLGAQQQFKKGKLPPMIGHDNSNNGGGGGCGGSNKVQLSAGDLLGRTHEELVLLLIQLRRQSSALIKARDACLQEMESQVKLASLDINHRQECLIKTAELKHHVKELEKQLDKLKPLVSLVDNMVKLGSSSSRLPSSSPQQQQQQQRMMMNKPPPEMTSTAVKRNLTPLLHQQQQIQKQLHHLQHQQQQRPPMMNNNNNNTIVFHSTPLRGGGGGGHQPELPHGWEEAQISQLESKHHQLAQLEKFVRDEGMAIEKLTSNQQVLRLAINGVRQQAAGAVNFADVEHCRQQQLFLERELGQIHALLALSSKRLEDAAVEISRIEHEISVLHQQLHRVNSARQLNRSSSGREMIWLEAELDRVHQNVSQLQNRRLELSSQVNRLTAGDYLIDFDTSWNNSVNQRPLIGANGTWCETDMDSLNTIDRSHNHDDSMMDINEGDERMKRYYGIVPKQQQQQQQMVSSSAEKAAEIRTVRIVKRESEKRQRDKTANRRSPYDDLESGDEQPPPIPPPPSNGDYYNDPIMDDPVLSQFSHVLTLPRNNKRASIVSTGSASSQRNSFALKDELGTPSIGPSDQWRSSLRPRRNLASLTLSDRTVSSSSMSIDQQHQTDEELLASLESTQRSPVLTPVYTSDAAREIVEEMRRQDQMTARRAVPRHKRRHITISCSQPLALEALSPQLKTYRSSEGRARDDVDLQRALRLHPHPFAPDVVRSTISQAIRINEKTIDKILSAPDKIVIPERYVPEQQVEEVGEEEKQRRLKKTESIRRMLTGHGAVTEIPRPPSIAATSDIMELSEAKELLAKERQQRDHFISLNQMLVQEIKEKSKMAAATQNLSMDNGQFVA